MSGLLGFIGGIIGGIAGYYIAGCITDGWWFIFLLYPGLFIYAILIIYGGMGGAYLGSCIGASIGDCMMQANFAGYEASREAERARQEAEREAERARQEAERKAEREAERARWEAAEKAKWEAEQAKRKAERKAEEAKRKAEEAKWKAWEKQYDWSRSQSSYAYNDLYDELFGNSDSSSYRRRRTQNQNNSYYETKPPKQDTMSIDECYACLGCTPQSGNEALTAAYRKLVKINHPDKLGLNASQEDKKRATERFTKIKEAYERIKALRGMK